MCRIGTPVSNERLGRRNDRERGGYTFDVLRRSAALALFVLTPLLGGCNLLGLPIGGGGSQPLPEPAASAITTACNDLATAVKPFGVNTLVLTTTCTAAVDGQGSQLLQTFLASPQLGCIALAGPVTALVPTVATACQQFTAAIQPYSALLGGALQPLTG